MTITEWLAQPNRQYNHGVMLFKRHGNNAALLTLFESGENSMTRKKLLEQLRELNENQSKPDKPKQSINIIIDGTPKGTPPVRKDKPDFIVTLEQLKIISFKEMAALHAQLESFKTDKERFDACLRIDELDQLIDECWYKLDYFKEHGYLPFEQDEVVIKTIRDVVQLCKNIPTYFTKINAKLNRESLTEDEAAELGKQKTKWTLVMERINTILDEPIHF